MYKIQVSDTHLRFEGTFAPATVLKFLLVVIFVLGLCGFFVNYNRYVVGKTNMMGLYAMFNMDWEGNIPTLFSALDMLLSATLLFAAYKMEKNCRGPWHVHYLVLAIVFLLLACDEVLGLHEKIGHTIAGDHHRESPFALGAIFLAVVLIPPLVVFCWRWLLALPRWIALVMILSGAIYLAGAVGMEKVSIHYAEVQGAKASMTYQMLAQIEEMLEMIGIAIFNYILLKLLLWQHRQNVPSQNSGARAVAV
jgi:hypothetical protein